MSVSVELNLLDEISDDEIVKVDHHACEVKESFGGWTLSRRIKVPNIS